MKNIDIQLKYFIYINLEDYKNIYKVKRYYLILELIIVNLKNNFLLIFLLYSYFIIYIININLNKIFYIYKSL